MEGRFLFQCDKLPSVFYARFRKMRHEKKLCDMTIKFGNDTISAHRLILSAAIPYFSDMFVNTEAGSDIREMNMEEVDPSALKSLIDFAYNCEVEITGKNVLSLLRASCFLNVGEVRDTCCDFIGKRLKSGNVLFTRRMAEELSCFDLVEASDAFICENFDEVAEIREFLKMSYSFMLELLSREDLRTSSEANVFQCVMKWVKASPDERKSKLPELLGRVRLKLLTPQYLMDHVLTEEYIKFSVPCRYLLDEVKLYHMLHDRKSNLANIETKFRPCPRRQSKSEGGTGGIYTVRKCLEVQYFDPGIKKWTVLSSTPLDQSCTQIAIPEKLLLIDIDFINWYTPSNCNWVRSSIFVGRVGAGAAVLDDSIYICGGRREAALNEVEQIVYLKHKSQKKPPMSVPRNLLGVVTLKGHLYALGGKNGVIVHDSVERFDPKTSQWIMISSMNCKRYGMSCIAMNNKIYVCGGKSVVKSNALLSSVEVYDSLTNQWGYISPMKSKRYMCSLVTYCGKLCALGGYGEGCVFLCSAEIYDPDNNKWKTGPSMDLSHEHSRAVSFSSINA